MFFTLFSSSLTSYCFPLLLILLIPFVVVVGVVVVVVVVLLLLLYILFRILYLLLLHLTRIPFPLFAFLLVGLSAFVAFLPASFACPADIRHLGPLTTPMLTVTASAET